MKLTATFTLLAAALTASSVSAQSDSGFDAIVSALSSVSPSGGPGDNEWPLQPAPAVEVVAALDSTGDVIRASEDFDVGHYEHEVSNGSDSVDFVAPVKRHMINKGNVALRRELPAIFFDRYTKVFGGNNSLNSPCLNDSATQGPAYLTYTVVTNSTNTNTTRTILLPDY